MVPSEQLANVVFVVEGTANLIPYVESLKANYIVPTLEYFNGGALDDYEYDNMESSNLYGLVVFMASDSSPDLATSCHPVTSSTNKFLSWFDKSAFLGGGAEAHSHIAEGLGTALQLFADLATLRSSAAPAQNYCVLVCNSSYYSFPVMETPAYSGMLPEQLVSLMVEQHINFSIFSPRKIPSLYKLFELGGGDLQQAHSKNFAKDKRHLILLQGFQLQECPINPPAPPVPETQIPSPLGAQKRSNSPSVDPPFKKPCLSQAPPTSLGATAATLTSQASYLGEIPAQNANNAMSAYLQSQQGMDMMNQPNPPNVNLMPPKNQQQQLYQDSFSVEQQQHPASMGHTTWNQASSYNSIPVTNSILGSQLSMMPRPTTAPTSSLNTSPSQFMYNSPQSSAAMPQRSFQAAMQAQQKMSPHNVNMANGTKMMGTESRSPIIWQGIVEFYEKPAHPSANRSQYSIPCTISSTLINGEPEISSEHWPQTLSMTIIYKQVLFKPPLSTYLKASRQVEFQFNKDTESFQALFKAFSNGLVGCIQFPPTYSDIRIMIVIYVMDKQVCLGLIAKDQEGFFSTLRQLNENQKKQAQMKQRMMAGSMAPIRPPGGTMQQQQQQLGMGQSGAAPLNAQQQQQQQHRFQMMERQKNLIKLHHLHQSLDVAQLQKLVEQKEVGYHSQEQQGPPQQQANPQLRHLLQLQQPTATPQQLLLQSRQQQQQQQPVVSTYNPGGWDDKTLLEYLPPNP